MKKQRMIREKSHIWYVFVIVFFLTLVASSKPTTSSTLGVVTESTSSGFKPHGPYIDELHWKVYPYENREGALQALKNGDIDGFDERMTLDEISTVIASPGVTVTATLSSLYRVFSINCARFPTDNIGYRRALAYLLDKYFICEVAEGGYAEPLDGLIPVSAEPWTYEDQITEHFYTKDITKAIESLETAGFKDLDDDGWREYDTNGNDVWDPGIDLDDEAIAIELKAAVGYQPHIQAMQVCLEGMAEVGLRGILVEKEFSEILNDCEIGEFWLISFTEAMYPPGFPSSFVDDFYSGSPWNFLTWYSNAALDDILDSMMSAPTFTQAREYAWQAQEILLAEMPMISIYSIYNINAYRTDQWEDWITMQGIGVTGDNLYSNTHVHLKSEYGGPFGGTLRMALTGNMETTNAIMAIGDNSPRVFSCIYDKLWQVDPYTWELIPRLAYDWTIEETTANGDIQDGMKFTFTLYSNATWHDGTPVTAEDVKYSLETIWPQSPNFGYLLENIYQIDTPDLHTVEIYSNSPGYFEFISATDHYIFPKHIWEQHEPTFDWEPVTSEDLTGSGPFKWMNRIPGEQITLSRHSDYHIQARSPPQQLKLKLSGNFDYLLWENIHPQLAATLTDSETDLPISGATVTASVYDPDGDLLINAELLEVPSMTGVYVYNSPKTLRELRLPKGIYLVYVHAVTTEGAETFDILQFHIDPPSGDTPPITTVALGATLLLTLVGTLLLVRSRRHL